MIRDRFFKVCSYGEKFFALLQGKGYGSFSVKREARAMIDLIGDDIHSLIDIGAHKGDYTHAIMSLVNQDNLTCYCIEPSQKNFKLLQNRFKNQNVTIINKAIAEIPGRAQLCSDKQGGAMASLNRRKLDHFKIQLDFTEEIEVATFEQLWNDMVGEKNIDIIKIDVEGLELPIIKSLENFCEYIRAIQFEFGGTQIDNRDYFQDFWYLLDKLKFDIYRVTPFGPMKIKSYSESDEHYSTTNFICVNRRYSKHYPARSKTSVK